jgi:ATP-dependent DNA helicase RecG
MDIQFVEKLVANKESSTLELKRSTGQLERGMESICAFLNANGGIVVFGVSDDGAIVGQMVTDSTKRDIAECIRQFEPFPLLDVDYVGLDDDKQVIVISAHNNSDKPYAYRGRPYMRVESTTTIMPQYHYKELLEQNPSSGIRWEQRQSTFLSMADLDEEEIRRTVRNGVEKGRLPEAAFSASIEQALVKMELLSDGKINNAAAVLYMNGETMDYPQCLLRLARFAGTDKKVFIDNKQVRGNLFKLLDEAMAFFFKHLLLSGEVKGLVREEHLSVPYNALRECVINALIHREYNTVGGSVGIAIYDDRIEISNIGHFPPNFNPSNLQSLMQSIPYNPIIAKALYYRGLFENWGRGIGLVKEECVAAGLPEPTFVSEQGAVVVTIKYQKEMDGELNGELNGELSGELNNSQRRTLEFVKSHSGCTAADISEQLGVPFSTIDKHIRVLLAKGFIERRGSKKTGGYYARH